MTNYPHIKPCTNETPEMLCPFHRASVIERRRLGLDHGIRQSSAEREADRAAGRDA